MPYKQSPPQENNTVKRKKKNAVTAVSVLTAALITANIIVSNFALFTKRYETAADNAPDVRIAFASDLHIGETGISPERIANKIKKEEPDIICLAGDIFSGGGDALRETFDFLTALADIAPVYFSLGNHELDMIKGGYDGLIDDIEKVGVTVLNDEYRDIIINGAALRIGGMLDDVFRFYYTKKAFAKSPRADFLRRFSDTELYTVMLCHRSDSYNNYKNLGVKIADLILSGHTHGGVVRVPFGKAVYVPDMGWFPELSYGRVKKTESEIIVSSGTAAYGCLLRFNNPCEICVAELKGNAK